VGGEGGLLLAPPHLLHSLRLCRRCGGASSKPPWYFSSADNLGWRLGVTWLLLVSAYTNFNVMLDPICLHVLLVHFLLWLDVSSRNLVISGNVAVLVYLINVHFFSTHKLVKEKIYVYEF